MARLTPFEIGQIKAHLYHDLGPSEIAEIVVKADGQPVSVQGVCDAISKLEADAGWRGERASGSGRPRKTTPALDRKIVAEVFRSRGSVKVTVAHLRKKFPSLRALSTSLVEERLHEAGLQYMRRRRKTLIPKQYKKQRMELITLLRNRESLSTLCFAIALGFPPGCGNNFQNVNGNTFI